MEKTKNKINYFKLLQTKKIMVKDILIYDLIDLMENLKILLVKIKFLVKMIQYLLLKINLTKKKEKNIKK